MGGGEGRREEGGSVTARWDEGSLRMNLDRLTACPGDRIAVTIDGRFGSGGRWQSLTDPEREGPDLNVEAGGVEWHELNRDATSVSGELVVAEGTDAGAIPVAFRWVGSPCRESACLPAVERVLRVALMIDEAR